MGWVRISVATDAATSELVEQLLETAGAVSVTLLDAADELLIEPEPGVAPVWKQVRVAGLFAAGTDSDAILRSLDDACGTLVIDAQVELLADRDWSTTWRDGFRPMRFGERLWVCPVGDPLPERVAVVLRLDPGNAFGTGAHATTAMCLEWLDRHPPVDATVIDYGCGSGILAIAAALLGAVQVYAVDIDPQALQATRENAVLNRVMQRLDIRLPVELPPRPLDLVIANILANPLRSLAAELNARLRPGGSIIMTGIIAGQEDAVMAAYAPWIDFDPPQRRAEWVFLSGCKRMTGVTCQDSR